MQAPPFQTKFYGPKYWLVWVGLGLMRMLHLLPIRVQLALGEGLGRFLGRCIPSRRRIVRANLLVAFPTLSASAREKAVNDHFAAMGRGLFETAIAWWSSDDRIRPLGQVEGIEHLQLGGQGALLLTGHFTTLELGARFLCLAGVDFHAMYRPYANELMDYFMHRWRQDRSRLPALPRDELRTLIKALRDGAFVWYAPDQAMGLKMSIYVPFFGKSVATITATSKLALLGRAAVVPFFPSYLGNGRYRVVIDAPLLNFPGPDGTEDAQRINDVLEAGICRYAPIEYFWVHRRFKHIPPGDTDIYSQN